MQVNVQNNNVLFGEKLFKYCLTKFIKDYVQFIIVVLYRLPGLDVDDFF